MGQQAQQEAQEAQRDAEQGLQRAEQRAEQGIQRAEQGIQQAQQQLRRQGANELTGMEVKNRSGESLGKVKDFVIDASSGQVIYTVVGSGGVLGIGEKLHAVPVSALNYDASSTGDERLTIDIAADRWSEAPRFRKDSLASLQADQEGRSTFEYYGQTWPTAAGQSQASTSQQQEQQQQEQGLQGQQHQFVMASDIIGKDISSSGQDAGSVEDVFFQLQNRTAALLIDPSDDFAGAEQQDQKYIVPFNKLTLAGTEIASGDTLSTSLTRDELMSAQVAQGDSWASAGGANNVYVLPQDESAAAERVAQSETAMGRQQETQQGQPPVAEIRRALESDSSIAQQGGNAVSVIAQGDKVVLLGTVQSEEAKDRIEQRAEQAAQGWDIENQISVAIADE